MATGTQSRSADLAEQIETAIVRGELAPGTRLGTKDELRRRYGVAYGTLNEALRMLQQRGYVLSRSGPGGGLFAAIPELSERLSGLLLGFDESASFADCATVRRALGKRIIVDAARACTPADAEELRALIAELERCALDGARYGEQVRAFHRRVAQIGRNRVLANLYLALGGIRQLQRERRVGDENRARNLAVHREIAEAIAQGSLARAERAAQAHENTYRTRHSTAAIPARPARVKAVT